MKPVENITKDKAPGDAPAIGDRIRETITDAAGALLAIIEREYHGEPVAPPPPPPPPELFAFELTAGEVAAIKAAWPALQKIGAL